MSMRFTTLSLPLDLFEKLTDEQLHTLVVSLNEVGFPLNADSRQGSTLLPILRSQLSTVTMAECDHFFGYMSFVLNQCDDYDEFREIIDDSIDQCENDAVKTRAETFFDSFAFREYFDGRRLGRYLRRANNYYTDIQYACDLRGRFDKDFGYSDTPLDEYEPVLVDVKPIVTLMIELHDGENGKRTWFQADADDLNEIIAHLLAAQRELKILSEFSKRGSNGSERTSEHNGSEQEIEDRGVEAAHGRSRPTEEPSALGGG